MIGIVRAFAVIMTVAVGFAIREWRAMLQPFESMIHQIEEELSQNRHKVQTFQEIIGQAGSG